MRQYQICICWSCMKTNQVMMVVSTYLDEPRMYNKGVSWVHLGVYFSILSFRIRYESMSLMYEGLSLYEKVKYFEYKKNNKSSIAFIWGVTFHSLLDISWNSLIARYSL